MEDQVKSRDRTGAGAAEDGRGPKVGTGTGREPIRHRAKEKRSGWAEMVGVVWMSPAVRKSPKSAGIYLRHKWNRRSESGF